MVCGLEYMMAIRLVLATDYLCVREALEALLQQEPDVHIVAHGQSGEEILHAVRQHRPDVLILPIGMPGKGGLEVLREMRQAQLPKRVVLLEACRALWSVTSGRRLAKPPCPGADIIPAHDSPSSRSLAVDDRRSPLASHRWREAPM